MRILNAFIVLSMGLTACMPLSKDIVSNRISKKQGAAMNISNFLDWDGEEDLVSSTIEIE